MPQKTKSILIATVLFIVDSFMLNQGIIAAITAVVIICWLLPKAIILNLKKESPKDLLKKSAVFGVMALAIFAANYANNNLAKHRAEFLITVIEKYHDSTGRYPETLKELVPAYIPAVPVAKYILTSNDFRYINYQGEVLLSYAKLPPFDRQIYRFKEKSWGRLD